MKRKRESSKEGFSNQLITKFMYKKGNEVHEEINIEPPLKKKKVIMTKKVKIVKKR